MSNPFGNPYEPSQPADSTTPQPYAPQSAPTPGYVQPVAPQPYLAPSSLPKPVAPKTVAIAMVILGAVTVPIAFNAITGTLFGAGLGSQPTVLLFSIVVNIGLILALRMRPGKAVQVLTTAYSALWCLTVIGALAAVPIIVLLWKQDSKDYFAAGDQWSAARASTKK